MIFLATLEVANRFRSLFAEEEASDYREALEQNLEEEIKNAAKIPSRSANRKAAKTIIDMVGKYREQNTKLTHDLLKYVHGHSQAMTEEGRNAFLSVADTLQMLTMELNRSKNPKQMLSACQLYNAGIFDKAFADVEETKKKASGIVTQPEGIVDIHGNKIA